MSSENQQKIPLCETDIEEEEEIVQENGTHNENTEEEGSNLRETVREQKHQESPQLVQIIDDQGEIEVKVGTALKRFMQQGLPTFKLSPALRKFPRRMEVFVGSSFFCYYVSQKNAKCTLEVKVDTAKQILQAEFEANGVTPSFKLIKEAGKLTDEEIVLLKRKGTISVNTYVQNKHIPKEKRKRMYHKMYWNLNRPNFISAIFSYQNEKNFEQHSMPIGIEESVNPGQFFADLLSISNLRTLFKKIRKDDPKLPAINILQLICLFSPKPFIKPIIYSYL